MLTELAIWPLWRTEGPGWPMDLPYGPRGKKVSITQTTNLPYGLGGALETLNTF